MKLLQTYLNIMAIFDNMGKWVYKELLKSSQSKKPFNINLLFGHFHQILWSGLGQEFSSILS